MILTSYSSSFLSLSSYLFLLYASIVFGHFYTLSLALALSCSISCCLYYYIALPPMLNWLLILSRSSNVITAYYLGSEFSFALFVCLMYEDWALWKDYFDVLEPPGADIKFDLEGIPLLIDITVEIKFKI